VFDERNLGRLKRVLVASSRLPGPPTGGGGGGGREIGGGRRKFYLPNAGTAPRRSHSDKDLFTCSDLLFIIS